MRSYKILPKTVLCCAGYLSKDAQRRLAWMDWYFAHGKNAESTCRHFGISKSVFYRWLNRFNRFNLSSLEFDPKSRRPHNTRNMTTPQEVVDLVVKIRKEDPEKSKYEIQAELKDLYNISLGYNTIQKIINRTPGCYVVKPKSRKQKHKVERIKAPKELKERSLGSLIQVDTKHLPVLGTKFYVFAAIDCKSRYAYTWAYTTISSKSAKDFLTRVKFNFPFPLQAVNTDNGSEYLLYFHQATQEENIPHYFSYPATPKMNSRVERLIKTFKYEFLLYQDMIPEIAHIRTLCEIFNTKYNFHRYHQALNYKTPNQFVLSCQKGGQPFSI